MNAATLNSGLSWYEATPRNTWAIGSSTVAIIKASIDTNIALHSQAYVNYLFINLGANENTTDWAAWESDYCYIIDALLAKWPGARIYLVKAWSRGRDAYYTTMHGHIDDIIALYPGKVFAGHDESVWLKSTDDGYTMTIDGTHYSSAAHTECAAQWKTILGY